MVGPGYVLGGNGEGRGCRVRSAFHDRHEGGDAEVDKTQKPLLSLRDRLTANG